MSSYRANASDCLVWYRESDGVRVYPVGSDSTRYAQNAALLENILADIYRKSHRKSSLSHRVGTVMVFSGVVLAILHGFLLAYSSTASSGPVSLGAAPCVTILSLCIVGMVLILKARTFDPFGPAHAKLNESLTSVLVAAPDGKSSGRSCSEAMDRVTPSVVNDVKRFLDDGNQAEAKILLQSVLQPDA